MRQKYIYVIKDLESNKYFVGMTRKTARNNVFAAEWSDDIYFETSDRAVLSLGAAATSVYDWSAHMLTNLVMNDAHAKELYDKGKLRIVRITRKEKIIKY